MKKKEFAPIIIKLKDFPAPKERHCVGLKYE